MSDVQWELQRNRRNLRRNGGDTLKITEEDKKMLVSAFSRGSKNHHKGQCRPCKYTTNWQACPLGADCCSCHFVHSVEKIVDYATYSAYRNGGDTPKITVEDNNMLVSAFSLGSKNHHKGQCRPCKYAANWQACPWGADCCSCHFVHSAEKIVDYATYSADRQRRREEQAAAPGSASTVGPARPPRPAGPPGEEVPEAPVLGEPWPMQSALLSPQAPWTPPGSTKMNDSHSEASADPQSWAAHLVALLEGPTAVRDGRDGRAAPPEQLAFEVCGDLEQTSGTPSWSIVGEPWSI